MKIEEIVMYPTQLIHVETTKVRAERLSVELIKEFGIFAETKSEIIDNKTGKCIITICVDNESYCFQEEKIGIFSFENEIQDTEKAKQFLEIQGVRILWSYLREDIFTISSKMLPKPIMLPTIDVMKTLEKAK